MSHRLRLVVAIASLAAEELEDPLLVGLGGSWAVPQEVNGAVATPVVVVSMIR